MSAIVASALSLSKLVEIYNLLADKPVKAFRDKPTAIVRVEAQLTLTSNEIFAVEGEENEYDVRPIQVEGENTNTPEILDKVEEKTEEKVEEQKSVEEKPAATAKVSNGKRGPAPDFADSAKITVLVANPKRAGSASFARFALYSTNDTVGKYLAAGGVRADLKWDAEHGFIEVAQK